MYSKSFLEAYKNQNYIMKNNIKMYYSTFKIISASLVTQSMLDNYSRYCWFLAGLPRKMRLKLMNKHDVDSQNLVTMKFEKLYNDALKKTQKME